MERRALNVRFQAANLEIKWPKRGHLADLIRIWTARQSGNFKGKGHRIGGGSEQTRPIMRRQVGNRGLLSLKFVEVVSIIPRQ